jgi:GNAT superfamily N-acetyltransferase
MSFWSEFPGPHWSQCIESLNPCAPTSYGICNPLIRYAPKQTSLPPHLRYVELLPRHAKEIETLLKRDFTIYPRCKLSLSEARIRDGFVFDKWIGVGIFTLEKTLIGCCISKPLGKLKLEHEMVQQSSLVDYFCVHHEYRKQGVASALLTEFVLMTARHQRLVHLFLKEGFPLWKVPPLYTSQYLVRQKGLPGESKEYFGSMGIGLRGTIQSYSHADYLPLRNFIANLPSELNGDSELFSFNYKGHSVFLCMTDIHHRTVPEGHRIGELAWILPQTAEVPLAIQKLAVETCVDCGTFDLVLLDKTIPHDSKQSWKKDAAFSWYVYNYNPGSFFTTKPFFIV